MANEPERLIEKLLRACARKRREEASAAPGFELHPATRRLLQGEVARRFPQREPARSGAARWWQARFWPRLAEACVLVALLAVVGYVLVPAWRHSTTDSHLARNDASQASLPAATPSAAPATPAAASADKDHKLPTDRDRLSFSETTPLQKQAPALAETATSEVPHTPALALAQRNSKLESADRNSPLPAAAPPPVAAAAPTKAAPDVSGAPRPSGTLLADGRRGFARSEETPMGSASNTLAGGGGVGGFANKALPKGQEPNASNLSFASRVVTNALPSSSPAAALNGESGLLAKNDAKEAESADSLVLRQRFAQVPLDAKAKGLAASKATLPVLVSFQVQQAGRDLRVIDSDGSVYTGSVQNAEVTLGTREMDRLAGSSPAAARMQQSPVQSGSATAGPAFQQEPVRYFRVAGTNRSLNQPVVFSGSLTRLTNGVSFGKLGAVQGQAVAEPPPSGPRLNVRISGQAVIGKGQVVPVNAVPTP